MNQILFFIVLAVVGVVWAAATSSAWLFHCRKHPGNFSRPLVSPFQNLQLAPPIGTSNWQSAGKRGSLLRQQIVYHLRPLPSCNCDVTIPFFMRWNDGWARERECPDGPAWKRVGPIFNSSIY
jgi:hypothetical protein